MARRLTLALALVLVACRPAGDAAFDALPKAATAIDPTGQWVRADGQPLGFFVSRGSRGAWVVESLGRARPGQAANACWGAYVGAFQGVDLVTTSDLDRDFQGELRREDFPDYAGLFVEFRGDQARLSGPEADDKTCPLKGVYVRRAGDQPTASYLPPGASGPAMGTPPR